MMTANQKADKEKTVLAKITAQNAVNRMATKLSAKTIVKTNKDLTNELAEILIKTLAKMSVAARVGKTNDAEKIAATKVQGNLKSRLRRRNLSLL